MKAHAPTIILCYPADPAERQPLALAQIAQRTDTPPHEVGTFAGYSRREERKEQPKHERLIISRPSLLEPEQDDSHHQQSSTPRQRKPGAQQETGEPCGMKLEASALVPRKRLSFELVPNFCQNLFRFLILR
jgi:hypothetical protein